MPSVLVTTRSFSSGDLDVEVRLADAGWTVLRGDPGHRLSDIGEALATATAWISGTGPVADEHFQAAPELRIVARYGVGTEAVDLAAARRRGVTVANTPGANSDAVADHAVGLMLAALRSTTAGDRAVRRGDWSARRGRELGGLTVGIVGFGKIGRGVARRLSGFGSRLIISDPWVSDVDITDAGGKPTTLKRLIESADLVTLHAPGGQQLVTPQWTRSCKQRQVIVNTARPDLVDEEALVAALRAERVSAFAADTIAGDVRGERSPLLADDLVERVTITPHSGSLTVEAIDRMGEMAVDAVLAFQRGETPASVVTESER